MKPKRIFLVRHGESQGNEKPELHSEKPDYTMELTHQGLLQASEVGAKLRDLIKEETVFFYISPFWRTRSTAEQIARHFQRERCMFREEPRLREQEWGHLRPKEETDILEEKRDSYSTFYYRLPDGESGADVYDRVSDFFGTLHRDFEKEDFPDNVIIVTHGMTIRLFLMRWFHWSVEEFEEIKNPSNCDIFILEKQENEEYTLITALKYRLEPKHPYQRPLQMF
ncbi:MAG TPA: histidine phosphatase family protein [Bacteroidales bacterium]|nr:histidine phosphatase family protein [Bacteroidales bacterium]HPJ58798.1 histidine phosphatase family protein [Bacteroidales bacterium]HPR11948.1 histidine phosphatase family protein [Bacteroidales bacterium]HRW85760.1 histidine phosphatase family protein [Bacteroidales bacterium]